MTAKQLALDALLKLTDVDSVEDYATNFEIVEAYLRKTELAQVVEPIGLRDAILAALSSELSYGAYDCTRVWEAWSVGTMGQDDFSPITERLDDIVGAVANAIAAYTALDATTQTTRSNTMTTLSEIRFGGRCEKHLSVLPCKLCYCESSNKKTTPFLQTEREALQQEPVAWRVWIGDPEGMQYVYSETGDGEPLYLAAGAQP